VTLVAQGVTVHTLPAGSREEASRFSMTLATVDRATTPAGTQQDVSRLRGQNLTRTLLLLLSHILCKLGECILGLFGLWMLGSIDLLSNDLRLLIERKCLRPVVLQMMQTCQAIQDVCSIRMLCTQL